MRRIRRKKSELFAFSGAILCGPFASMTPSTNLSTPLISASVLASLLVLSRNTSQLMSSLFYTLKVPDSIKSMMTNCLV